MPTVYITQETANRNFLPARKYGSLKPLMPGNAQVVLSTSPTLKKLRFGLKNFTDEDYLLLSGDPIIMGIMTSIASAFAYLTVVASPTCMIIHSTGLISSSDYFKAGWKLFIISVIVLLMISTFYWPILL